MGDKFEGETLLYSAITGDRINSEL